MKPVALIAIASGSNDVDVIVTSSQLSNLGMEVVIASADGWSPVTLESGLVIKPTCSLDRALDSITLRGFSLLLLPGGDDISVGRIEEHPKLPAVIKTVCKETSDESQQRCIIAAGRSARILHGWGILNRLSDGLLSSVINSITSWLIQKTRGSKITFLSPSKQKNLQIILCSSTPALDPLLTVSVCATAAKDIMQGHLKQDELDKYGNYKASMLESCRKFEKRYDVSETVRNFLLTLSDNPQIPAVIRKWCLSPICATISSKRPRAFHAGKIHPGNTEAIRKMQESDRGDTKPSKNTIHVLKQSSTYVVGIVWKFIQESLRMRKGPLSMCRAAVLVANRVNEELLVILVHELRSKFKIMTHVIACDRGILRTADPFIITHGMKQIRSDNAIETVRPCYDVIIVIDSEVDSRGPGMWYRKSTFNWEDFETIKKEGIPAHMSCVTATFDQKGDYGKSSLESVTRQTRKKLNPLTNQYITWEDDSPQETTKPLPEATFFEVCNKRISTKDGLFKERDCHDLVFQSFLPFHNRADMHTTISSQSVQDALDFARAVTDCLRRLVAKKGYRSHTITNESRCSIL